MRIFLETHPMTLSTGGDANNSALAGAVQWIASSLTGSVATSIAVVALALSAIAMLQGRVDIGRLGKVALGAFILFGSPFLASELVRSLSARDPIDAQIANAGPSTSPAPTVPKNAPVIDPYAGASVPQLQ
jgi:type IV secretory pathway VirB2 component (pilin)